jgi:hypothetical protein
MKMIDRQQALDAIPNNWLDPLLTGDGKVIHKSTCPEIEALLKAVRARIAELPTIEAA